MSANVPAPRARTHRQRRRRHALIVFTACDQRFHVAGGGHSVLLRQDGDLHGRRWNTNMECRSTSGRFSRAAGPGCDQGSTARSWAPTVGCCTALFTSLWPVVLYYSTYRPFQNDEKRWRRGAQRSVWDAQRRQIIGQGCEKSVGIDL